MSNDNRNEPAYPKPSYKGMTKIEFAAVEIMAGLFANPDHQTVASRHLFARVAADSANALFDELDRLEADRLQKMDGEE